MHQPRGRRETKQHEQANHDYADQPNHEVRIRDKGRRSLDIDHITQTIAEHLSRPAPIVADQIVGHVVDRPISGAKQGGDKAGSKRGAAAQYDRRQTLSDDKAADRYVVEDETQNEMCQIERLWLIKYP